MGIEVLDARNGRWYRKDGGPWVPSVTSVTGLYPKDEGFDRWLAGSESYLAAMQQRDQAAASGEKIHRAVEVLVDKGTFTFDDSWTDAEVRKLQGFANFMHDGKCEVMCSELALVTPWFGGRVDLILRDKDGSITLLDVKSGNGVYDSHWLQVVAYAVGAEQIGYEVRTVGLLQLKSSTKKGYQLHELTSGRWQDTPEWAVFQALRVVHARYRGSEPALEEQVDRPKEVNLWN